MKNKLNNYQIWLIVLILFSLWVIASVGLEIIPLIPSKFSGIFAAKFNQVSLNVSYSILAAYIFYWFTYFLPRKTRIYRSKKILSQQVHWLLYELFVLINQILYAYDLKKTIYQIEEKDLRHIDGDISKSFNGVYQTSEHWKQFWKKGKQFTGFGDIPFTFPDDVHKKLSQIPELIKKIRQANPNFYTDETFAEILASIETNKIIEWYSEGKQKIFRFAGSSTQLFALINEYKMLLSLKYNKPFRNSYQLIHFYTPEEIRSIPEKRKLFDSESAPKRNVSRSLSPCIVYNLKYYDSRALVSELNGGAIVTTSGLHKEFLISTYTNRIAPPNNSKCIVIIGEQIPKKEIKEYIKSNQNDKVIIWIKSSLLVNSSTKKIKERSVTFGVYEIYYRKPLTLFQFQLFGKYPTKEIIGRIRFNVGEIMRNFRNTNELE